MLVSLYTIQGDKEMKLIEFFDASAIVNAMNFVSRNNTINKDSEVIEHLRKALELCGYYVVDKEGEPFYIDEDF